VRNTELLRRTSFADQRLTKWSNGSGKRKKTQRKSESVDVLEEMIVGTIEMVIVQNHVVVVCRRHQKLMLTRLTAERQWLRDKDRRDDRHGRLDRVDRSPPPRLSHYDRERREREEERERLYRTRGDPRGSRDELNYGEESKSVTGSERRRRRGGDSDGESVDSGRKSNKRYRRERRPPSHEKRSKTPEVQKEVPEPVGVHSGSEEGEIEED
jgi:hypothetical protein